MDQYPTRSLATRSIGSSTVEQALGNPEASVEGSNPSRSVVFGSWQGLGRMGCVTLEVSIVNVMQGRGSDGGGRENGGESRVPQNQELPELRAAVRAEEQNQSDLPACSVPPQEVQAVDVHRSGEPSKQTGSSRRAKVRMTGLCLSRFSGEKITCMTSDGVLTIAVIKVAKGRVRLLFNAPKEVRVYRSELLNKESLA